MIDFADRFVSDVERGGESIGSLEFVLGHGTVKFSPGPHCRPRDKERAMKELRRNRRVFADLDDMEWPEIKLERLIIGPPQLQEE